MQNPVKNRPRKKTLKKFQIDTGQPIAVRFTNPTPNLTRILVGGEDLTKNSVEFAPLKKHAIHKLDFEVQFQKGKGEDFLNHFRKVDIEIRSGDRVYCDTVLPDAGGRTIAYRFVDAEFGPNLIFCLQCDDYVQPGADGRCKIHH
jgi:hypothetical protein